MTDWKKRLNLNSYEWWRNHRRVVTFGGFLLLFAWYINPVIQVHRNKITCAELAIGSIGYAEAARRVGVKKLLQFEVSGKKFYCEHFK